MTVSSYNATYDMGSTPAESSMFGTPIYARRARSQDKNNKIFMGAAAVGVVVMAGALLWATAAANQRTETEVVAAQPVPAAPRAMLATPVTTPVTPAIQPVLEAEAVQPVIQPTPAATPRATPAPQTRVVAESAPVAAAPSAVDAGANVSTREYAPVTPEPVAAPAPMIIDEPMVPVIAE